MHSRCVCVCVLCSAHGLLCVLSMFYTSVVRTGVHDHCFSLNTVVHTAGYELTGTEHGLLLSLYFFIFFYSKERVQVVSRTSLGMSPAGFVRRETGL